MSLAVRAESEQAKESLTSDQRERIRQRFREISENPTLTEEMRRLAYSELGREFRKTAFVNIVEEPEQNLFPESQWGLLKELLSFNNRNDTNRLILTTHSPYLINYLSIAIQGNHLERKIIEKDWEARFFKQKMDQLGEIIPPNSTIQANDVAIYQLEEHTGTIGRLPAAYGIPLDDNYLNQSLRHGNDLFDQLLALEQAL